MIKLFIMVSAIALSSHFPYEGGCKGHVLSPTVKFFISEKDAVGAYANNANEKRRLFVAKFSFDKELTVEELFVYPATSYEVFGSSTILISTEPK